MTTLQEILQDTCRKAKEHSLSEAFGEPITLTNAQFKAIINAEAKAEHEQEIEAAIELLKSNGYTVTK